MVYLLAILPKNKRIEFACKIDFFFVMATQASHSCGAWQSLFVSHYLVAADLLQ